MCGCGSSLSEFNRPADMVTIGVNDVGRLFDPTYLVVVNPRNQFKADRFRFVERSGAKALFTQLDLGAVQPPVVRFRLGKFGGTELGATETLHYTQNSPYVAVCLAAYMGAKRIGLVGVDFTDDHFFGRTGRHSLAGRLGEIDAQYGKLAGALHERGVELLNLSARSRLTTLPKADLASWQARPTIPVERAPDIDRWNVVSYATTPVAGVPAILARCIAHATPHEARCVWARSGYGNGVEFSGDVEWGRHPAEAVELLRKADVVIAHNGRIEPAHRPLLRGKPIVTMAHNYGWNVDMQFVRQGHPGVVVGQYQATLPEFAGWQVVPNPVPLWEPDYRPEPKGDVIRIAYTPSGRHERYPQGHRLYWHAKGFQTTMAVLTRLARTRGVSIETTSIAQVSHAQALAMKRRSHIVIDECVTGSYHRNSLEGLATGCVVVNGVGSLAAVEAAFRRCAPESGNLPFVGCTLESLEATLSSLIEMGPAQLEAMGRNNRLWMERHWNFAPQWERFWHAECHPHRAVISASANPAPPLTIVKPPHAQAVPRKEQSMNARAKRTPVVKHTATPPISVIVPHGGTERLPQLMATLATLRQREDVHEIVVVEMGEAPSARDIAGRWADKHFFIRHTGAFERARALNAGQEVSSGDLLLWIDNDLLMPEGFLRRAATELQERSLDYLIPYSAVRYLSEADSKRVIQGACGPADCAAQNILSSGSASGGMGLVKRSFIARHGGMVEGFRGWGGEDNAWNHKVALLGRTGRTLRRDQNVHHLFHPNSGGHAPAAAGQSNPHYRDNVALMGRVMAVRQRADFVRLFPASAPAPGDLTDFGPLRQESVTQDATVWTYWEGPCPEWIRACLNSISNSAANVRVLTPESFDRLRDRDRDVDLSRLQIAHRADYIRVFLLHRYGGLWVDADCLVMQSLEPVLAKVKECDLVGHRERSGLASNGFLGARAGSPLAARLYERVRDTLRSGRPLGWTTIGSEPLSALLSREATGWHELPCRQIQPVCWSEPEAFFAQRETAGHEKEFDAEAICYMLSNTQVGQYAARHAKADIGHPATFFSYVLGRSMARRGPAQPVESGGGVDSYEAIFSHHADLYRGYRDESISGPGSGLAQTQALREQLPLLLGQLGVRTLLDAPCGDFNWMRHVRLGVDQYVGIDIMTDVIADNQWRHGSPARRFIRADLVRSALPRADVVLCRDLLPHLSCAEIMAVLQSFRRSGATYLLTTTFTGRRPNRDTAGGEWRTLNLTLPPFNFPEPRQVVVEKCSEGGGAFADKSLGVWLIADIPAELGAMRADCAARPAHEFAG